MSLSNKHLTEPFVANSLEFLSKVIKSLIKYNFIKMLL